MVFRFLFKVRKLFALPLLVLVASAALLWLPAWQSLERRGFDALTVFTAPGTTPLPIVLIAIDDASLGAVPHPWPWPRSLHAQLINKLKDAGAAVIAFDILFSTPAPAKDQKALASAIARAGNVVLATGMVRQETPLGTMWARQEPMPDLLEAGAQTGVVNLAFDPDLVMRTIPTDPEAFWRRILVRLRQAMPEQELPGIVPEGGLIRYVGPPGAFPSLPYHMAIELEKHVNPEDFQGAVVIVGRSTRSATDIGMAQGDLFSTPFSAFTGELTPGTEIHANILDSIVRQQSIRPLGQPVQVVILVILAVLASAILAYGKRRIAYGLLFLLASVIPVVAWALFHYTAIWLPVGTPLMLLVLLTAGHFIRSALAARRQRDRVQQMFALYVPPDLVKSLVAHPELAGIGGETRRLTVMFCDLRGFTTLSSQLTPAEITAVLNRYFTCMTDAIFAHGGTVDKFIGDAVMAFWGAPLPDEQQEHHALLASQAMRASLAELNTELSAEGHPPLRLGIGLHSGEALVGNMGSASRLSYTAIGDTVNVASRLEGANKAFGTEIMLSADTAKGAGEEGLRPLGAIRVKGRPTPLEVFTPCVDPQLIDATQAALAAQRMGEMDMANQLWRKVLTNYPDDALAGKAIQQNEAGPWDGVLDTDK
jgi:adenylate cyclase